MRAAVITEPGGPEVFAIQELPDPVIGPEEVLVAVRATALNRADLLQRRGRYPGPPGTRDDVPGLEMAGEVIEVGANVRGWKPGDRVMALLGGATMSYMTLGISFAQFIKQLQASVGLNTFLVGIAKAPVFALVIAMVGCYEGLRVTGSAESVGRLTTRSVVEGIFLVIIMDALFSILFSMMGV